MVKIVKSESKFCFIISHIGEQNSAPRNDADLKLKHFFSPVLKEIGYNFKRADEESTPGFISAQIVKRLIDSTLVIADISLENANVFYELAIRHAVKKPVIIIKKLNQKPPFDVTDIRAIDVDMSDPDIWQPAMKKLRDYIKDSEKHPNRASESILSTFSRSFGLESKEDKESETLLLVKDIRSEFSRLRYTIEDLKRNFQRPTFGTGTATSTIWPSATDTTVFSSPTLIEYRLKCKNCKSDFIPLQEGLGVNLLDDSFQRFEICPHCHKSSVYGKRDYAAFFIY